MIAAIFAMLACLLALMGVGMFASKKTNLGKRLNNSVKTIMKSAGVADPGKMHWSIIAWLLIGVPVAIIALVVIVQILAALTPTYSSATNNFSSNFSTANWGNATANSLGPIFGLIISLAAEFLFIGIPFVVFFALDGASMFGHRRGAV